VAYWRQRHANEDADEARFQAERAAEDRARTEAAQERQRRQAEAEQRRQREWAEKRADLTAEVAGLRARRDQAAARVDGCDFEAAVLAFPEFGVIERWLARAAAALADHVRQAR
jgi:hypothetical protein